MKRQITITFEVDPTEYHNTVDSDFGVVDLVNAMFMQEADFPEQIKITCGTESHNFNPNGLT